MYFPEYDLICHGSGPDSPEAHAELRRTDRIVGDLLAALPRNGDTLVVLTADHGQSAQRPDDYVDVITKKVMKTLLRGPVAGRNAPRTCGPTPTTTPRLRCSSPRTPLS